MDERDKKAMWMVLLFLGIVCAVVALATLPGCWPIRVDPQTDEVCPNRPNCGQCASDELCAWLLEDRVCSERRFAGDFPQVRVLEDCPDGPEGERVE